MTMLQTSFIKWSLWFLTFGLYFLPHLSFFSAFTAYLAIVWRASSRDLVCLNSASLLARWKRQQQLDCALG